ncbi:MULTISPECIES: hypothetical protein [unclassified Bradyrhizobium]|uniref:hypothetical protein n=1 Tax=unclassified Bradyrhizobium TaxID=2631580 RepID=UPI001FF86B27|nr:MULTISPECIES: hypothetical protein [unclassified Bradyrhizobium]MCK1294520.1 hypothetical protein [Bradyrhizobium sp. 30]MCK1305335.1 hypothetical protein [Bradyrhizobium sp. 45]MCK1318371.1 hypothetical protein [Bradyrhizobium sp. 23]MCK1439948.1 hypothetical protein [Bradyrhizobium sp. 15]MCK1508022.1 hypothetical protein [Bradyrhizobium sp. 18]
MIVVQRCALGPKAIYDLISEPVRGELKLTRHHFYRRITPGDGLFRRADGRWTVNVGELWETKPKPERTAGAEVVTPSISLEDVATDVAFMVERYGAQSVRQLHRQLAPRASYEDFLGRVTAATRGGQGLVVRGDVVFKPWTDPGPLIISRRGD